MSILIKGMDLPKGCLSCDFCNPFVEEPYCRRLMQRANGVTRLPACPLIPIPDHGRLIDADKLCELCDIMAEKCDGIGESIWNQFRTTVEWSPTIIEAEE